MACFVALKKEIPSIVEPVHLRSQELLVIGTMKSVSESRVVGVVVIRFLGFFPPAMDIHPQITRFGIDDDRRARVRSSLAGQRFETGHRSALAQSFFSIQTRTKTALPRSRPAKAQTPWNSSPNIRLYEFHILWPDVRLASVCHRLQGLSAEYPRASRIPAELMDRCRLSALRRETPIFAG